MCLTKMAKKTIAHTCIREYPPPLPLLPTPSPYTAVKGHKNQLVSYLYFLFKRETYFFSGMH